MAKGKKKADVKAVLYIEVPQGLKEKIEALAERHHRKISGEVIHALEQYIARETEENPKK